MASYKIKCPECDYTMTVKNQRVTRNYGKTYDWTQYWCKYNDIWIELEVPVEDEDKK